MSASTEPVLTPTQLMLLRAALGLARWTTVPTRDWLPGQNAKAHPGDCKALEDMGYFIARITHGQGGEEHFYQITDAGRERALAEQARAAE